MRDGRVLERPAADAPCRLLTDVGAAADADARGSLTYTERVRGLVLRITAPACKERTTESEIGTYIRV